MNYEDRMRMMAWAKPEKKDELLLKLMRGEQIDLHKDEDLFYQLNRNNIDMDKQVNRDKYKPLAEHMKHTRDVLDNKGWDKAKTRKYLGEIPADIWFTHPWFSPSLPKQERDANVRKFFKLYPQFGTQV